MTLSEAETARHRAVTGLRNLSDDEAAARFDRMTPQQYAQSKGIEILRENPRSFTMAGKPQREVIADLRDRLADLEDQVEELQTENESLQDRLDAAADAIAGEDEGEDEEEADLEDEDDSSEDDDE
jgi:hypothetical protein